MKNVILPAICILWCTLCLVFIPTEADASIYDDTLRLHIKAPSDSIEDQNLKLEIRDFILKKYGSLISGFSSSKVAERKLSSLLPDIEEDCKSVAASLGFDYSVSASISEEWFNTREYTDFSLPAGRYVSLSITIGEGLGQNWWCVMYPPLCLDAALSDCAYTESETRLITKGGYRIKFKLLEVSSAIFNEEKKKFGKSG